MSNHITDEQLARVVATSQAKAASRIGIMFDADEKGDEGAKDALWRLGDHVPRRALHFVSQTVCEPSLVTVVMKDGLATITAHDDVVNRTGELQTRQSGHRSGSLRVERRTNAGYSIRLKTEPLV